VTPKAMLKLSAYLEHASSTAGANLPTNPAVATWGHVRLITSIKVDKQFFEQ
jgi:hypothetical protein